MLCKKSTGIRLLTLYSARVSPGLFECSNGLGDGIWRPPFFLPFWERSSRVSPIRPEDLFSRTAGMTLEEHPAVIAGADAQARLSVIVTRALC